MNKDYSRNLIGYGANPPHPKWPNNARIAVSFVLNYEEGGERCILHGDDESEAFLSEIPAATPIKGERHISMESIYEYGSRAGVWRVLRLFEQYDIPLTIFAVAMAVERYPEVAKAMKEAGHEICSHGYRWIDYQYMDESEERDHMAKAISIIKEVTGERLWVGTPDVPVLIPAVSSLKKAASCMTLMLTMMTFRIGIQRQADLSW